MRPGKRARFKSGSQKTGTQHGLPTAHRGATDNTPIRLNVLVTWGQQAIWISERGPNASAFLGLDFCNFG